MLAKHMFWKRVAATDLVKCGNVLKQGRVFSDDDFLEYSKLSHVKNPLHFDPEFAKIAGFSNRLVPGMLVASLFPRTIASNFPGAVYVSQSLNFKLPVYIGEEIFGEIRVTNIKDLQTQNRLHSPTTRAIVEAGFHWLLQKNLPLYSSDNSS